MRVLTLSTPDAVVDGTASCKTDVLTLYSYLLLHFMGQYVGFIREVGIGSSLDPQVIKCISPWPSWTLLML